jgi:hypothetical protein
MQPVFAGNTVIRWALVLALGIRLALSAGSGQAAALPALMLWAEEFSTGKV